MYNSKAFDYPAPNKFSLTYRLKQFNSFLLQKKVLFVLGIIFIISALILVVFKLSSPSSSSLATNGNTAPQLQVPEALATVVLNKELSLPIKDSKGVEIGEVKYIVESADLRNEIIVKGQKATAVQGRTFLIFNLRLVNETNQGLDIKSRDFVRVSINNEEEWLAADIHNDPVEVQAISTKYTRIGFPINNTDKDIKVQLGEINGDKEIFNLIF